MPLSYTDVFSDFPEILRLRKRDLKTTHSTFRSCRVHSHAFFRPFLTQLYIEAR